MEHPPLTGIPNALEGSNSTNLIIERYEDDESRVDHVDHEVIQGVENAHLSNVVDRMDGEDVHLNNPLVD